MNWNIIVTLAFCLIPISNSAQMKWDKSTPTAGSLGCSLGFRCFNGYRPGGDGVYGPGFGRVLGGMLYGFPLP